MLQKTDRSAPNQTKTKATSTAYSQSDMLPIHVIQITPLYLPRISVLYIEKNRQCNNEHIQKWSYILNANEFLKIGAKQLIAWLKENQNNIHS